MQLSEIGIYRISVQGQGQMQHSSATRQVLPGSSMLAFAQQKEETFQKKPFIFLCFRMTTNSRANPAKKR